MNTKEFVELVAGGWELPATGLVLGVLLAGALGTRSEYSGAPVISDNDCDEDSDESCDEDDDPDGDAWDRGHDYWVADEVGAL
ncbi:hypothetical protein ACIP5Y_21270 [Nocardia sp. NPDC088792]|uniref:hypothetical protein n=1 Tax=Nocardia sp. NPDC088792 TaxID=3364332 RepID=UPI003809E218